MSIHAVDFINLRSIYRNNLLGIIMLSSNQLLTRNGSVCIKPN